MECEEGETGSKLVELYVRLVTSSAPISEVRNKG